MSLKQKTMGLYCGYFTAIEPNFYLIPYVGYNQEARIQCHPYVHLS